MVINMWRTTKRENSTATPTSQPNMFTNKVQFTVSLKEETDVLNPTFILNISGHDGQNYVEAFGRFYWVTNIKIVVNNVFEISCKIDALGSYRGHIRNTEAYVLYDSTPNTEIPDKRLGVNTTATYSTNQASMPWGFLTGTGTKFVALEGDGDLVTQGKAGSATGVYIMTDAEIQNIGMPLNWSEFDSAVHNSFASTWPFALNFANLPYTPITSTQMLIDDMGYLFNNGTPTDFMYALLLASILVVVWPFSMIKALIESIKGFVLGGDALKHVKSAYWLPFDLSSEGTGKSNIALGSFVDTNLTGKLITNPKKADEISISIPWQYGDWRNVQNTEVQLYIPLIGNINIPSSAVKGHSTIDLYFGLNMFSGAFAVRVRCGGATLGTYGCSCLSPIFIGDSNANVASVTNTVASVAGTVAGLATGNVALSAGAVSGVISSGLDSIQPISTSVGGIGGGISNQLGSNIFCTTICHNTSDAPSDLLPIIGTPTNVLKQLNGSGYCQCYQPHMSMNAVTGESYPTASEVDIVNNYLSTGVFLE